MNDGIVNLLALGTVGLGAGVLIGRFVGQRQATRAMLRDIEKLRAVLAAQHELHDVDEAKQRTILDAMVEGVFVTDREGRIAHHNAALERLTSSSPLGKTPIELVRSTALHDAVTDALAGERRLVQIELGSSADARFLSAQVAPLPQKMGAVVVLHDITHLKLAETVRRDFVANASHELRTPLTAIRGFAETLTGSAMQDPVVAKRFAGRIVDHAVRLQQLVDDMMALSRAEAPDVPLTLEDVDVVALVQRVLRGFESLAAEKKLALSLSASAEPVFALADEKALEQVVVNLVDNAVKYTAEGSVTVRVRAEGERVYVEVVDTGGGIAASHLPRIFERFYRVDPGRAREVGGTGLGLAIVKHLSQRLGGDVSVESTVGRGTTFRVHLRSAAEES